MTRLEPRQRLISCIMPRGLGLPLLRRLSDEKGIRTADVHSARGFADADARGVFGRAEVDVLSAVVPAARAVEVFEWMHGAADVATTRGRLLFMARLAGSTPFRLPEDVPEEG